MGPQVLARRRSETERLGTWDPFRRESQSHLGAGAAALHPFAWRPIVHDAILGRLLGAQQRLVRRAEEIRRRLLVVGEARDSHADRDADAMLLAIERLDIDDLAIDQRATESNGRTPLLKVCATWTSTWLPAS